MKFIISILISLVAQASMATCVGEAQIIAKVQDTIKTLSSCVAFIEVVSVVQYNQSMACPLGLDEVLQKGVEVGFSDGHDCRLQAGDMITGVLVKNAAGTISLE